MAHTWCMMLTVWTRTHLDAPNSNVNFGTDFDYLSRLDIALSTVTLSDPMRT